jgi:hypothetical protein
MRVLLCFNYGGTLPWDYLIHYAEEAEASGAPTPLATHAYFTFLPDQGGSAIVEAVPPKVRQLNHPEPRPNTRAYKLAEGDEALTLYAYAASKIGALYDLPGLLVALGFVEHRMQDHWYQMHHSFMFCSELCVNAIRQIRPCLPDLDADVVTPSHLEASAHTYLPSADKD